MEGFVQFLGAIVTLATPISLFHVAWSTLLGIIVGSLPGLTATMGVALLTTLTYSLDRDAAILTLICMYVGAIYGGSRSAILLNIPGTPASAATSLDGYPLARQGKAAYAMGLATGRSSGLEPTDAADLRETIQFASANPSIGTLGIWANSPTPDFMAAIGTWLHPAGALVGL